MEALATARSNEVVLWLPQHETVVTGDVVLGAEGGGLRLCPPSWLPESKTIDDLRESLRPLLDLPIRRVLVSHGEPVLEDGAAALAAALS
jgi:glyoxylase-like metal-dependent hydrolase (beta-lactamase superfamily II)